MWFIALDAEISVQRWIKFERADHQDQGKVQVKLLTFDLDPWSRPWWRQGWCLHQKSWPYFFKINGEEAFVEVHTEEKWKWKFEESSKQAVATVEELRSSTLETISFHFWLALQCRLEIHFSAVQRKSHHLYTIAHVCAPKTVPQTLWERESRYMMKHLQRETKRNKEEGHW